jgi:hypothetical protein
VHQIGVAVLERGNAMTRTGLMLSSVAAAAMLALCADGPAIAEQPKPKPKPSAYPSKMLLFTLSTTQMSKKKKGLKSNNKKK